MALSWNLDIDEQISFTELVAHFDALGDRVLLDDLDESAAVLRKLYNNRHFLGDIICGQLGDMKTFEQMNAYTPQVFVLHRSEHYFVRAAIWTPPLGQRGDEIFFYEDPHDHNFTLLTLGYVGSGYRTILFEYDYAQTEGYDGEVVPARYLEETGLPEGRVMLYRKNRDIHVQLPPEEFSVSINILAHSGHRDRQYSFDLPLAPTTTSGRIRENLVIYAPASLAKFAHAMGVKDVPARLGAFLSAPIDDRARWSVGQVLESLKSSGIAGVHAGEEATRSAASAGLGGGGG